MAFFQYTADCLESAQDDWDQVARKPDGTPRPKAIAVFENRFIEKWLSRAHPITPVLWFGAPIVFGLWAGVTGVPGVLGTLGLFLLGWLIWTLMEYVLHRFLFHMKANNEDERLRVFLMHGYHHLYHADGMRLVAPPIMSWGPAVIVAVIWRFAFGPELWLPVLAGTMAGYLAYDWIHYYSHHFRPTWRLGKFLRRSHMVHHFKDHDANFGVSSPLWDFVFGTYRAADKSTSEATSPASG